MINDKFILLAANHAELLVGKPLLQFCIRNGVSVMATTYFTPVRATTLPAPAIKSILFFVVQRKEFRRSRLLFTTLRAS
jgi:hypothetical protein